MQQCARAVETKKFVVFPGRCLGQQKSALVESAGNAKMLENFSAPGDDGWFRRCSSFHGKTGGSKSYGRRRPGVVLGLMGWAIRRRGPICFSLILPDDWVLFCVVKL
jgi:hypothetical protein